MVNEYTKEFKIQDSKRIDETIVKLNPLFLAGMEIVSTKLAITELVCNETMPYGTPEKDLDLNWGIDWSAKFKGKEIGICARISSFNGFTIRKSSRGSKSEYNKFPENFTNPKFPLCLSKFYTFQFETELDNQGNKKLKALHIIKTKTLFDYLNSNESNCKEFVNKHDGNSFIFVPVENLIKDNQQVLTINLKQKDN